MVHISLQNSLFKDINNLTFIWQTGETSTVHNVRGVRKRPSQRCRGCHQCCSISLWRRRKCDLTMKRHQWDLDMPSLVSQTLSVQEAQEAELTLANWAENYWFHFSTIVAKHSSLHTPSSRYHTSRYHRDPGMCSLTKPNDSWDKNRIQRVCHNPHIISRSKCKEKQSLHND